MDIKKTLKGMPHSPGVYLMKDKYGRILYIGKAADLSKRLSSYFRRSGALGPKIEIMLSKVEKIDFKLVKSETEALLYESELIKKLRPKYNTIGRDDKSFPWIEITKEDFPRVSVARLKERKEALLIGPFTSAHLLKLALKTIRGIFPFRTCLKVPKKVCLDYYLELCPAPCISKISSSQYKHNIRHLRQILEGKQKAILKELKVMMDKFSQQQKFEQAARLRDQIQALETLWQEQLTSRPSSVLWQLKSALGLKRLPLRIEGFDISNISGNYNVGSLVSFYKGQPDKSQYRRYRIKSVSGVNDYASILEILRRRFLRMKEDHLDSPDLVVVDGGKAQVAAVKKALSEVGFDIPVIGIAKRKEQIFMPDNAKPVALSRHSKALHLIQYVRDEAHRFALKYHRLLRKKDKLRFK